MCGKQSSFSWGIDSLRKHQLFVLLILPFVFATHTQAKLCTSLKAFKKETNAYGQPMCTTSYKAKCGWFTFKDCTFYEKIPCSRGKNVTIVTYKIVTDCCPGYKRDGSNDNLTCMRNESEGVTMVTGDTGVTYNTIGDQNTVTQDEDEVKKNTNIDSGIHGDPDAVRPTENTDGDEEDSINISDGAFVAIACAGLFIICVTIVIIIHVRKKQLKEEKKAKKNAGNPETQKMIHI